MEWGRSEAHKAMSDPQRVVAVVTPKSGSPFITRKTASIVVPKQNHLDESLAAGCSGPPLTRPSLSEDSPVHDTATSTSSTAQLLKETAHKIKKDKFFNPLPDEPEQEEVQPSESPRPAFCQGPNAGRALLTKSLEEVRRGLQQGSPTFSSDSLAEAIKHDPQAQQRKTYVKNLIVLSLGYMLIFAAFCALRNLQSSINQEDGLGLLSLSSMNVFFVFGCVCATSIIQKVRPKCAILITMCGQLLFILANFYSSFYLLIPASAILGFCLASLWTAQGTYLTSIAFMFATLSSKKHDEILNLFNGFFIFLLQLGQLLGNLVSSTVFRMQMGADNLFLQPLYNTTLNETEYKFNYTKTEDFHLTSDKCGINYCHVYKIEHDTVQVSRSTIYILLGIFLGMSLLSFLIFWIFLDKLDVIFHRCKGGICRQMAAVFYLHSNKKQLLFVPMALYMGIEESFVYAEITKAYITCSVGIHMVGYFMMCFGACDALSSFLSGRLQKYTGRIPLFAVAAGIHAALMMTMFLWRPDADDLTMRFILLGGWAIADGIWQTQMCSLCGILFPKQQEAGFACLRMYEAMGNMIGYGYAQFLCMNIKSYITAGLLSVSMVSYGGLEGYMKWEEGEIKNAATKL